MIVSELIPLSIIIGWCFVMATGFTLAFADYSRWQFIDEDDGPGFNKSDAKWHTRRWQMATFVLLGIFPFIPLIWFPLLVSSQCLLWPLALNRLRKKPWLHVGTSKWDKTLGKWQYLIFGLTVAGSIAILFLT